MKLSINNFLGILLLLLIIAYLGKHIYMQPKFSNGEKATNFEAINISGEQLQLNDFKGKYVFLDFWGSWCPPCRKANQELAIIYQEYAHITSKGTNKLNFISIGVEKSKKNWEKAINRDKLSWPFHIYDQNSNMKFFNSKIANLYGVKSLPSSFVINPEGFIISVNPTPKKLREIFDNI